VSGAGARGLMQLMPGTARDMGVDDLHDPAQNIRGGTRYLAEMKKRFGDDLDLVLAGYNAGPGRVERAGRNVPDIDETRNYVAKVGDMYRTLKGGPAGAVEEETP
jgi:soluble lytic murein transglycosylase-like protein